MTTDNYAVLEVQGYVSGVSIYDRESKKLEFVVCPMSGVLLPMYAKGELAKAFKTMLCNGTLIQAKAIPHQRAITLGESELINTVWEAKRLHRLSHKKEKITEFADLDVLDGLMPEDDEYTDVGYVDPESWRRFIGYRKRNVKVVGKDD